MRAQWITDRETELVCSLYRSAPAPNWLAFGLINGYLEILPETEKYIPIKLTEKGFDWIETWKHGQCISGRKIK